MERVSQDLKPQRVFLCHGKEDKDAVRTLYRQLEKDGFNPWFDEEDIIPGQEWEPVIKEAVREAEIVLVCLSKSSTTRRGFAQKEIRIALEVAEKLPDGEIYIIPLRLEECEVPQRLGKWQWVDLFHPQGYERLVRALQVKEINTGAPAGPTSPTRIDVSTRAAFPEPDDLLTGRPVAGRQPEAAVPGPEESVSVLEKTSVRKNPLLLLVSGALILLVFLFWVLEEVPPLVAYGPRPLPDVQSGRTGRRPAPEVNEFRIQFRIPNDGRDRSPITVSPGRVLYAVHRTHKKAIPQPLVLCEEIIIEFGQDAIETDDSHYFISQRLLILGFYPAHPVYSAPAEVVFEVTDDVYLELSDFYHKGARHNNGCGTVRTEYSLESDVYDLKFPCGRQNELECIASLNERTEFKDSGKTVEWYMGERICIMQVELIRTASVWQLHCDSSRM